MKNSDYISFEDFQKESFKNNPLLKKTYDELDLKYEIIKQFIMLRNKLNITQTELEKLTGIKQSSISRFESGNLKNISIEYINKLVKPLGYKINFSFEKADFISN